jgi:drug/metabolite transporter (DMT)-like permease
MGGLMTLPAAVGALTPATIALVLGAALLHAAWNALLRSGTDRLWSMTVMSFATTLVSLPFVLILPLPAPASWPYIGLSTVLEIGYTLFLVQAYRTGDFSQVYPIARGSAPLIVTLAAAVIAGERPSGLVLTGIAMVSLGIVSLARRRERTSRASIAAALATGAFIASYTVSDGFGSRLAGNALSYSSWLFLLYGMLLPCLVIAVRGWPKGPLLDGEFWKAAVGGVVSLAAYTAVIWAVSLSPMGPVSALRETSVVFAAIIGRIFLGEKLTTGRLAACIVIAGGAICLGAA